MDDDFMFIVIATVGLHLLKNKRKKRRQWVRPIYQSRNVLGEYHSLVQEMSNNDPEMYFLYFRMSKESFKELLDMIKHRIEHFSIRKPISAAERLAITLRFLATGNSIASLSYNFRAARSTISKIIVEVTKAIWEELQPKFLSQPTECEWIKIMNDFWTKWNFPNCCGSIDGRHVPIRCPPNTGSEFFNYKSFFSVNLMAACDANYNFILVDVGCTGRNSDGGVFRNSAFGQGILQNSLNIPKSAALPGTNTAMPVVFVADEAFPLRENLMRPFPGKNLCEQKQIFNYRLSRARRVIENTFGIQCARWRVLNSKMCLKTDTVDNVILACCCLHNFMRKHENGLPSQRRLYCPTGFVDSEDGEGNVIPGMWRQEITETYSITNVRSCNNYSKQSSQIRDKFADYFIQPYGEVTWQYAYVRRGLVL